MEHREDTAITPSLSLFMDIRSEMMETCDPNGEISSEVVAMLVLAQSIAELQRETES